MLTPLEPNAGPTGGAGVALPASSASFTIPTTFLGFPDGLGGAMAKILRGFSRGFHVVVVERGRESSWVVWQLLSADDDERVVIDGKNEEEEDNLLVVAFKCATGRGGEEHEAAMMQERCSADAVGKVLGIQSAVNVDKRNAFLIVTESLGFVKV